MKKDKIEELRKYLIDNKSLLSIRAIERELDYKQDTLQRFIRFTGHLTPDQYKETYNFIKESLSDKLPKDDKSVVPVEYYRGCVDVLKMVEKHMHGDYNFPTKLKYKVDECLRRLNIL